MARRIERTMLMGTDGVSKRNVMSKVASSAKSGDVSFVAGAVAAAGARVLRPLPHHGATVKGHAEAEGDEAQASIIMKNEVRRLRQENAALFAKTQELERKLNAGPGSE